MDWNKWKLVINYNSKLLFRNKAYKLFLVLTFGCILFIQVRNQSSLYGGVEYLQLSSIYVSLPCLIPYFNVYLFSLFQIIPIVFLTSSFFRKELKNDTIDAIYYRPQSNTEYIWGVYVGFFIVFLFTGIMSMGMAALIQVFATTTVINVGYYLFYLFTLVVPSLVFTIGFSFFIGTLVRNQFLSLVILLVYFWVTVFYVGDFQQGIFDPLGLTLPNVFSEVAGRSDLTGYLLQRGCWLCLGLVFTQISILNFKRLPNEFKRKKKLKFAFILLFIGLLFGGLFGAKIYYKSSFRQLYVRVYEKYASQPKTTLLSQNIKYEQYGAMMDIYCELTVQNQLNIGVDKILLYLNPDLEIVSLTDSNREALNYEREYQVIQVHEKLLPGDTLTLCLHYSGGIDDNICYLDVHEDLIEDTRKDAYLSCRRDKRYVFLEDNYTLLIPEALWYPVAKPPVNPVLPCDVLKDFVRYNLQVVNPGKKTVISQGAKSLIGDDCIFQNENLLPGLSLCMGDYETRSVKHDSVLYEFNYLRKHADFFNRFVNTYEIDWSSFIEDIKYEAETTFGRTYPYKRFALIEAPVTFVSYVRNERGGSEFVQPEIVFLPEKDDDLWGDMLGKSWDYVEIVAKALFLKEMEDVHPFYWVEQFGVYKWNMANIFTNVRTENNPYCIFPQFYNHIGSLYSENYPVMDLMINLILNHSGRDPNVRFGDNMEREAMVYLSKNSLKEALHDRGLNQGVLKEILILKSKEILNYLTLSNISRDQVIAFISSYKERHKFSTAIFSQFEEAFMNELGQNWRDLLYPWYTSNRIASFELYDFSVTPIQTNDKYDARARIKFSLANCSEVDGIVNIQSTNISPAFMASINVHQSEMTHIDRPYLIKAGTGISVALNVNNPTPFYTLNTNVSQNIPNKITVSVNNRNYAIDTLQYYRVGVREDDKDPSTIIVDNEDEGFKIVQSSSRYRIQDLWNDKEHDKYENLKSFMFPGDRWKFIIDDNAYGLVVRSALVKETGSGKAALQWETQITRPGMYEIYAYIPSLSYSKILRKRESISLSQNVQIYGISCGEEVKEVLVDIGGKAGWLLLGKFACSKGKVRVTLNDQGLPSQILLGDAVAWVYAGNIED